MKITVAQRVIGGFTITSLLLIVISATALINLNTIDTSTQRVNDTAIPTLTISGELETTFLSMGLLATEAYFNKSLSELNERVQRFRGYRQEIESDIQDLRQVLVDEPAFSTVLNDIEQLYQSYVTSAQQMYSNHTEELQLRDAVSNKLSDIEDNADDASTLLLDFSDLDEVQDDSNLMQASETGSELESTLLSLLTVSAEYANTDTLVRADTIGNEVRVVLDQAAAQLATMQRQAGGRDSTGTLDEISEMVNALTSDFNASNGLLQLQTAKLQKGNAAQQALLTSEGIINQSLEQLKSLLAIARDTAEGAQQDVSSSVTRGNTMIIIIQLISLVLAVAIAFLSVRAITIPLQKVNDMLQVVSSGDLTKRLDDSSDDEFGTLATNCNNLIDSLKELISGIGSRGNQLAAASEQTSAVTAQTTTSIQEQKSQIGQVAAATTEMHSTSQLVSKSADDTLAQIQHADAEAEKVKAISLENKRTIEVLANDVDEAANVINKLHQDSASIGGILDVIRGVADQTNLLALNAAIEAARAGEQGRGFAVVADEVRTLASRTQESTQEINAMIEVLQAGAEKAVAVMNQGKEQTEVCVTQAESAVQALNTITDAVHNAHDVSTQIEQAAREQNVVSQEISEKLENIVHIAEETATGAQQTSDSSHEVARLAEELQESIQQFRV